MVNKKIVLIGPAGTGKTSIKKTFFEKYSPISLMEYPLKPSRGINSSNYNLLDSKLGVFDLAGQENESWLSNSDKSIFNNSNVIICIFDIHNSVERIIQFLLRIYQIKKELDLKSCRVVAFLHKIDLVSDSYIEQKRKTIYEFVTTQHPRGSHFEIFKTSITQPHYYNTFRILSDILKIILPHEEILAQSDQRDDLRHDFFRILDGFEGKHVRVENLVSRLKESEKNINFYINELEKIGFIKPLEEINTFVLSDSIYFYKIGLEQKRKSVAEREDELEFETFYFFIILNDFNA